MATAPLPDPTLYPDDAVGILEEILPAQNSSFELGLKLRLPYYVVEGIHLTHSNPQSRLLRVILSFLKVEPRPTWKVIVDALRSPAVNLPRLANAVEAKHFPDPTSTRDVVTNTTFTGSESTSLRSEMEGLNRRFTSFEESAIRCLEQFCISMKVVVSITKEMAEYKKTMRKCRKLTILDSFMCCPFPEHEEIIPPSGFVVLLTAISSDKIITFEFIEGLHKALCQHFDFPKWAIILNSVAMGAAPTVITWFVAKLKGDSSTIFKPYYPDAPPSPVCSETILQQQIKDHHYSRRG